MCKSRRFQLLLVPTVSLALLIHASPCSGTPAAIALVPGQTRDEHGRRLSDLRKIEAQSVYLFRPGSQTGRKIVSRDGSTIFRAQLSPDARLLAYALETKSPHEDAHSRPVPVQSVIITTADGVQIDSIPSGLRLAWNGMHFAWSPDGRKLAVVLADARKENSGDDDSLLIWDARNRTARRYRIGRQIWDVGWSAADSVLVRGWMTTYAVDTATGMVSSTWHAGPVLSPDRKYSLVGTDDQGYLHAFDDSWGIEITSGIVQQTAAPLEGIGSVRWIKERTIGHTLAVTVCDTVEVGGGERKRRCGVAFIDTGRLERLSWVPGYLIGLSADGSQAILLRNDSLVFIAFDRRFAGSDQLSSDPSAMTARLEVTAAGWRSNGFKSGRDSLGTWVFTLEPGDRFGPKVADSDVGPNCFRVVTIGSGRTIVESEPGLRPPGVVIGPANLKFRQRFVISEAPIMVSTVSFDGGIAVRLQMLDGGSRQNLPK